MDKDEGPPIPLRVVVVDGDLTSIAALARMLKSCIPDVQIVAGVGYARDAILSLPDWQADICFINIDLPRGGGFDVADSLAGSRTKTVFLTTGNNIANVSVKYPSAKFLTKPLSIEDIQCAVDGAMQSE